MDVENFLVAARCWSQRPQGAQFYLCSGSVPLSSAPVASTHPGLCTVQSGCACLHFKQTYFSLVSIPFIEQGDKYLHGIDIALSIKPRDGLKHTAGCV